MQKIKIIFVIKTHQQRAAEINYAQTLSALSIMCMRSDNYRTLEFRDYNQ